MPSNSTKHEISSTFARTLEHTFTAGATSSDWVKLSGRIGVQVTGPATSITLQLERSTHDPADAANIAPAGDQIIGNPSAGMQPIAYSEPGAAWWRATVRELTGASALVAINGQGS